ncbi:MAG TPA: hypothetical protein PK514_04090 [Spirochaetota bacterium]|nr:hypothetical protein [Spirochaetota bacterium]
MNFKRTLFFIRVHTLKYYVRAIVPQIELVETIGFHFFNKSNRVYCIT